MFHLFGHDIHPHPVMEGLAYAVAAGIHFMIRSRHRSGDVQVPPDVRLWFFAGVAVGALLGAKALQFFETLFVHTTESPLTLETWLGGKTIVGGMIGAWIGTEIVKRVYRIQKSTGDMWVFPLVAAVAIGRVGCFLTGLQDQTYGNFTALPWGVDFGDGSRHPTQLYEIAFVLLWGIPCLAAARAWGFGGGALFRFFMAGYMSFRVAIEFIKPSPKSYGGVSAIQIAAALVAGYCVVWLWRKKFRSSAIEVPAE